MVDQLREKWTRRVNSEDLIVNRESSLLVSDSYCESRDVEDELLPKQLEVLRNPMSSFKISKTNIQNIVKSPYRETGRGAFDARFTTTAGSRDRNSPPTYIEPSVQSVRERTSIPPGDARSIQEDHPKQESAAEQSPRTVTSIFEMFGACHAFPDFRHYKTCTEEVTIPVRAEVSYNGYSAAWGKEEGLGFADTGEEDGENQIRRLTSWATLGTNTNVSLEAVSWEKVDDDGLPIAKKLLESRVGLQKKRSVKFDYPPVSSLRECPRADPRDLSVLFFSEEELDVYEADRRSTFVADDVEIVAITNSTDGTERVSIPSPSSPSVRHKSKFGSYVPTPRKWRKNANFAYWDDSQSQKSGIVTDGGSETIDKEPTKRKPERLITSVQIFLRERSTGMKL